MALVSGLPADLPASICIVLHISPDAPGRLPHVLSRHTSLPVTHATDGFRLLAEGKSGAITVLQPGETLAVTYMLTIARD